MGYKYRRFGFGKKLNVPERVLERVYSRTATLFDAVQYRLEDKIPLNRFLESDRELITTLPLAIKQKIVEKIQKNLCNLTKSQIFDNSRERKSQAGMRQIPAWLVGFYFLS